jgi:hypothetical protein
MDDHEVLIHVSGWRDMLRYATHERNDSWNPPLFSLEAARGRELAWRLTPLEFAVYYALIAEYAGAPVMYPTGEKAKGSDGVPRRLPVRRAIQGLTTAGWNKSGGVPRAMDSLIQARLLSLSTVDGQSVDGPVVGLVKGRVGPGHGHGQEGGAH